VSEWPTAEGIDGVARLVRRLAAEPREDELCEFKVDNADPRGIGEYISALANSASVAGQDEAFMVWGVRDDDHQIVGTTFVPSAAKQGNEELKNWLLHNLDPQVGFEFVEGVADGARVVVLRVPPAQVQPVKFKGTSYIRIGTYKKKLSDHPEEERSLWRSFDTRSFESGISRADVTATEVYALIDYESYFKLLDREVPDSRTEVLEALAADRIIALNPADGWNITNLGAILLARDLDQFPSLARKAIRVIVYDGSTRRKTVREQVGKRGYASGFEGLVSWVNDRLPTSEEVGEALRRDVRVYPELAVRELLANALIHQDFTISGAGPTFEIFGDRIEVTNPGTPLVDTRRFVDFPPRSRNETLASLMRRMGVCEERGSGWDRIGFEIELHQLPAPAIELYEDSIRVTLFSQRTLQQMSREDRVRAVYLHACLRYVAQEPMTNTSVRARFGIAAGNAATASRLIADGVADGQIAPYDPAAGKRFMRYVPFWADRRGDSL
jgi:predicted HTH transcriptional regulator